MRVNVLPADQTVVVDGDGRVVELPRDDFIALGWDGAVGRVEWPNEDPEFFTDEQLLLPFVEAWEAAAPPPRASPEEVAAADEARFAQVRRVQADALIKQHAAELAVFEVETALRRAKEAKENPPPQPEAAEP